MGLMKEAGTTDGSRGKGRNRREFLSHIAAGFAVTGTWGVHATAWGKVDRRPNIVFVMPDQMRAHAMGCDGNSQIQTPNIDRLAGQGILLKNTLANTPVCCPARANILTGKFAHKNGMIANDLRLRETETTIAHVLAKAGYRTGFIGKWHLDGGPRLPGFVPPGPRRQGFEYWAANECSHRHFDTHFFRDKETPIPIKRFEVETWTDLGIEFLRQSREDARPFFLTIQAGPPHNPYKAPEQYSKLYDPDKLQMRPNWKPGPNTPSKEEIAEYYGMVTATDYELGRLLDALDRFQMSEDTIVLFASDHGDMLGSHGQRLKRKPWEESIRVPGIIRYPRKFPAGQTSDLLFSHVDFAPTLLGLCGLDVPKGMQGSDLSKNLAGNSAAAPESAFFQIFGPYQGGDISEGWRGVRTQRYMYARYESRPWVLYDLEKDPYELNNLINDPGSKEIMAKMDKALTQWMQKTGDSWSLNWTHPVEDKGRLYNHETFYTVDEYLQWIKENPDKSPRG